MGRFLAGSVAALLLVAAGLFWWQFEADRTARPLVARGGAQAQPPILPGEGDPAARGAPPPGVPQATQRTREQRRFDRFDRNRDSLITRNEMMATRAAAFRKLDKDGNNLLSFEEWAVRTSDRFAGADANKDGKLTPAEFATTAKKPAAKRPQNCACEPAPEED
ncbi:EF-hand domain-containing protein [Sphingobium nicotianae]|uniref:EF-hand domain-containing protein n=1 Tax=Sphingobium nicotianae TaxID=2782607 RepID=A0A9X1DCY6_9SPHN|nr:EF-hand domain-containing protein [Sphingobium nicotianae]MBT2187733.1 EF-hand domain-containing protein [Sphingobium nicotianae]